MAKMVRNGVLLRCQTNKKERDFRKAVELKTKGIIANISKERGIVRLLRESWIKNIRANSNEILDIMVSAN